MSDTNIPESNNTPQYVDIEKHMLEAIKKSKYVEHVVMGSILGDATSDKIIELLKSPKKFEISDRGLMYINKISEDGKVVELEECPNYNINVSADGKWLSSKISSVPFDIEQNGNIRKAAEAQAAYCLIVINEVLNDDVINAEILETVKHYNYSTMVPHENYRSFQELLESYLNYQSSIINVAVSAAKYKISDIKKDSEKFLKENIPEDRLSGLRELDVTLSKINREYSLGPLSPENVKLLTKLEVLKYLKERDDKINLILRGGLDGKGARIFAHPEAVIWKILNLSSEYVDPLTKRKIFKLAEDEVDQLYNAYPYLNSTEGECKQISDRWKKRYMKIARLSVRKVQIEKFLNNEAEYTLPVKL